VTEPATRRTRIPVEDDAPEPDPLRTGCLWVGGVLGVVAGIAVTFLAAPSILNFFFPAETIAVGESFEDSKLTMTVEGITAGESSTVPAGTPPGPKRMFVVELAVGARSSWNTTYENFVLVLDNGEEQHASDPNRDVGGELSVPQGGGSVALAFRFPLDEEGAPDSLHLEEPPVKFELPEPASP
jgi:hypothetical protein